MISVVIPIYNGEKDLPDLINCLKAQTYPAQQVEYLLVDNKSSDRTPAILAAAATATIIIHSLTENKIQSSYAARNTGIRASQGDIIAFTDADCRPQPEWLETLIRPFADRDVGIVAGEVSPLPGKTIWEQHAAIEDTLSQKHTLAHPFCAYGQTANLAVRRQILEKVGLFRPYLTTGGDADFCWRILRETSYRLEFAEDAIVRHRHRSSFQQLQSQWRRYGESNRYLHELHGVDLMRELTAGEYLYRLSRWLLKELPIASPKAIAGKANLAELFHTPIGLCNVWARSRGQQQAKLPEKAWEIERF
ncbi:glycosyltransferase [Kamptonema animale CS-326]|jgi:glycosyltransferase involved in cell wall biosynthesis|uniref:glycosyltransferase n=1 Tax=Kamptonema animale TaxID=92934 RepID=UPI00232F5628|nr:glycosyltransferase [Kamptonema animale]MDB9514936.1 glycosyltransferase [Kamptonema animale CS-326]